jgi:hypothetical protein
VSYVKGQIDEMNQRSDAIEKGMSDPITKTKDNLREARKALNEFRYDQEKWLKELHPQKSISKDLAERLTLLGAQSNELKKLGGNDTDIQRQRLQMQFDLQTAAQRAMGDQVGGLFQENAGENAKLSTMDRLQRARRAQQLNEEEAKEQERLKALIKGEIADAKGFGSVEALGEHLTGSSIDEIVGSIRQRVESYQNMLKASQNRVDKNNQTIDDETLARKKLIDAISQTQGKITSITRDRERLAKEIQDTQIELSYLPGSGSSGGLFATTDYNALARKSESDRLDAIRRNDLSYRIAHMNDPKNAAGGEVVTLQSLTKEMRDAMVAIHNAAIGGPGLFVQGQP